MTFIAAMLCSRLENPGRLAHRRYTAEPKLGQSAQVHIRYGRTSVDGIKALVDGTSVLGTAPLDPIEGSGHRAPGEVDDGVGAGRVIALAEE
jgi:hypothetical protein